MKKIKRRIVAAGLALVIAVGVLPLDVLMRYDVLYGDVNRSGAVDRQDADDLKAYLAELKAGIDTEAADVNLDGNVDLQDLLLLEKYLAGHGVKLGTNVTLTFDSDGGTPVDPLMFCHGTVLTDIADEPVTQKEGHLFVGWFREDGSPFRADNPLTEDLRLKARFEPLADGVAETPRTYALEDQSPHLKFRVAADDGATEAEVLNSLLLHPKDGSSPPALEVTSESETVFAVRAVGGFTPGATYELELTSDRLRFDEKPETVRKATFSIHKDDVDKLQYNADIRYIRDTEALRYRLSDGTEVDVLDPGEIEAGETLAGYFVLPGADFAAGDTLCFYKTVDPRERNYAENDYADDPAAFVKVTKTEGDNVFFAGIGEEDTGDVLFLPDTIPFSVDVLPAGDRSSVRVDAADTDALLFMGRTERPKIDAGDFVVLYRGAFKDLTTDSEVYYGRITRIEGDVLYFERTDADALAAVNEVFLTKPMNGDELLEHVDIAEVEKQVEASAQKSGFAEEAADFVLKTAGQTDNFKNMNLQSFSLTQNGKNAPAGTGLLAKGKDDDDDETETEVSVKAKISKNTEYFGQGLRLELTVTAEITKKVEDGEIKFDMEAVFVEEVQVKVSMSSHADVTWYLFVPVLDELTFTAHTDLKNYTSVEARLLVYTVAEPTLWEQFEAFIDKNKETVAQIRELRRKLAESEDQNEHNALKNQIDALWKKLPAGSEEYYDSMAGEPDETDVSVELNRLLRSTSEEQTEATLNRLMDRYAELMQKDTDWVTLVEKNVFETRVPFAGGIVCVKFAVDFVIKTNINVSLGTQMEYLVGKRYTFWFNVFQKTSGNSVTDLTDEKFAFLFYVMGHIGLKTGVKATVSLEVLWGLAEAGISGEFGPYLKLYGYFIYSYAKMRPAGSARWNTDTLTAGALYLEFGIYVTISAEIEVIGKTLFNPDLYDKEFPLLTAGHRKNVYAFGNKPDPDETVLVKDEDNNGQNGIAMRLPDSYRLMTHMDLTLGQKGKAVYDLSNFAVTLSNGYFEFDPETGVLSVNPPEQVHYLRCNLTLTWRQGKMTFRNKDLRMVIPLVWTDLSETELKEKFSVTVLAGNEAEGYVPVWNMRVQKGEEYSLPSREEILDLLGYDEYAYGGDNLKYESVGGYRDDPDAVYTTYADREHFFEADLRTYEIVVRNVHHADGGTGDMRFYAKFGEAFDLSGLQATGHDRAETGRFTAFYDMVAVSGGKTQKADLGRVITKEFAKELPAGTRYEARYADNSVKVTYRFAGDVADIEPRTAVIKRGTVPPDRYTADLAARKAVVQNISPRPGVVLTDTFYTVVSKFKPIVMRTLCFETDGGTEIEPVQIPEESPVYLPTDPVKTGYAFEGWYTDPQRTERYVPGEMPARDLTLYAKWSGLTHTVTFDPNGGTLPGSAVRNFTNGLHYAALPVPTRTAYKFTGWFTARSGGTQIREGDAVHLLSATTLYARWTLKASVNDAAVTCANQTLTYNRQKRTVTFGVPAGMDKSTFVVSFMRQGYDTEWMPHAQNAGVYNVKIARAEDDEYRAFEKTFRNALVINKAAGSMINRPSVQSVYYGTLLPKAMTLDTDYVGEQLEFAASASSGVAPADGWTQGAAYNIYDSSAVNLRGSTVYLWARVADSENYHASAPLCASSVATVSSIPKGLVRRRMGGKDFMFGVTIKTSNKDRAGTDSKISVKIGDGAYTHLDKPNHNDFEINQKDLYFVEADDSGFYRMCGGTVPLTLKYEKSGSYAGWHCEYIKLDLYVLKGTSFSLVVDGPTVPVNKWYGAEDNNRSLIEETSKFTGFERSISFGGSFSADPAALTANAGSSDFAWSWSSPAITDSVRSVSYNPYEFLNAPVLKVDFGDHKFNPHIVRDGATSFKIKSADLYKAMVKEGVTTLSLTYSLEFPALNGQSTVKGNPTRTKTVTVRRGDAVGAASAGAGPTAALLAASPANTRSLLQTETAFAADDTAEITLRLTENPGLWGLKFAVNYNPQHLEPLGVTPGDVFEPDEIAPTEARNGRYVFVAARGALFEDNAKTGKLVTLRFRVRKGSSVLGSVSLAADRQGIGADGRISAPVPQPHIHQIAARGNPEQILPFDTVRLSFTDASAVQTVRVKKDDGEFVDISDTYKNGHIVTENGNYTFEAVLTSGETAQTSVRYERLDNRAPEPTLQTEDYTEGVWTAGLVNVRLANAVYNLGTTRFFARAEGTSDWVPVGETLTLGTPGQVSDVRNRAFGQDVFGYGNAAAQIRGFDAQFGVVFEEQAEGDGVEEGFPTVFPYGHGDVRRPVVDSEQAGDRLTLQPVFRHGLKIVSQTATIGRNTTAPWR